MAAAGVLAFVANNLRKTRRIRAISASLGTEAPILTVDGQQFRDLNKNGLLDPYEDSRLPVEERVEDLIGKMALEEKAGLMLHTMMGINTDASLADKTSLIHPIAAPELVAARNMNHFHVL